tara:strand:- start:3227 stop:3367 length:141 start_codon:yes stop_codon:yes gene_type:complete
MSVLCCADADIAVGIAPHVMWLTPLVSLPVKVWLVRATKVLAWPAT